MRVVCRCSVKLRTKPSPAKTSSPALTNTLRIWPSCHLAYGIQQYELNLLNALFIWSVHCQHDVTNNSYNFHYLHPSRGMPSSAKFWCHPVRSEHRPYKPLDWTRPRLTWWPGGRWATVPHPQILARQTIFLYKASARRGFSPANWEKLAELFEAELNLEGKFFTQAGVRDVLAITAW